jgi:cation diffusion facilitator family transporter
MLARVPPRRSSAALRSAALGESARTILIAFVANVVIAAAKLIAGLLSGSVALLAEAAHSFADSVNEVLLGVSLRHAKRSPDAAHPLGHGRARFLWAFVAALASFLIGGCLSIGLAIWELLAGGSSDSALVAWPVLAISFAADGVSWLQGARQARREAREHGQRMWRYLLGSSDPALRAVMVENSAALAGLVLASAGLLAGELVGNETPDAVAALLIGVLLALTAFGLARPLADFLIGRSLPDEQLGRLYAILAASPAIEQIVSLQAVYTGPEEAVVGAKVHPAEGLTIDALTRAMDGLDLAIRSALPEVADVYLDVTTYRLDTRSPAPGVMVDAHGARPPVTGV